MAAQASDMTHSVWSALVSSLAWPFLIAGVVILFRLQLKSLLAVLADRFRSGAAIKVGAFEVGAVDVSQIDLANPSNEARKDLGERENERDGFYRACRAVLLVHRLARSKTEGQLFDILVYLVPHEDKGTLASVQKVDYFLGRFWNNVIFTSTNRSAGFPFRLAAYGPTLCSAKLYFNDGETVTLYRYLDFEMGASAPLLIDRDGPKRSGTNL